MKNSLKFKRGFTLVEILIVIAIIGILASIALIGLGGSRVKARDTKRVSEVRQIQTALELYLNRCGYYPGPATCAGINWGVGGGTPAGTWNEAAAALRGDTSLTNLPLATNPDFVYWTSNNGQSYIIGVKLERANAITQNQVIDTSGFSNNPSCLVDATNFTYCVHS